MIIDLKDINKSYPGAVPLHVLKDVNLQIEKGELVSIMGASGSGKSTLLNILGILDNYDSGEYHLDGVLIKNLTENKAADLRNYMIGFVFQSFNLIGYKTRLKTLPSRSSTVASHARNATSWLWSSSNAWAWPTAPPICQASCREVRNSVWP